MYRLFVAACALTALLPSMQSLRAQPERVVAYFPEWSVEHGRYFVKDLETHRAADKIGYLMYAFSEPVPDSGGEIVPGFMNAYEAYQRNYSADISVDGLADDSSRQLRGEFNQLLELKRLHPGLRVLVSIGGWTGSGYFSDALASPSSMEKFADAIIDRFIRGNLPPADGAGGKGAAAGVFDGIDIDWEYPVSGGNTGNHHNTNDAENLTAFYRLMRAKLDSINPRLILTAAVPASGYALGNYEIRKDQKFLNWYNLMTYDFTGAWDSVTAHHANLFLSPDDPVRNSFDGSVRYMIDSLGVAPDKVVPGVAFYGRGWQGVGPDHQGLYQPALGAATIDSESGIANYCDVYPLMNSGFTYHWDPAAMAPWIYNPEKKIFWSLDDAKSIALKSRYASEYGLGGIMCWDITGDDSSGSLVEAMASGTMPDISGPPVSDRPGKPSISITSPIAGTRIESGTSVIINIVISGAEETVVRVEYFVDGKSIGCDSMTPFDWVWFNARPGIHQISAKATDSRGHEGFSKSIPISVIKKN